MKTLYAQWPSENSINLNSTLKNKIGGKLCNAMKFASGCHSEIDWNGCIYQLELWLGWHRSTCTNCPFPGQLPLSNPPKAKQSKFWTGEKQVSGWPFRQVYPKPRKTEKVPAPFSCSSLCGTVLHGSRWVGRMKCLRMQRATCTGLCSAVWPRGGEVKRMNKKVPSGVSDTQGEVLVALALVLITRYSHRYATNTIVFSTENVSSDPVFN